MQELAPTGDISYSEIARQLDFVSDREKQPMYRAIRDFIRRGECVSVGMGAVRYVASNQPRPARKTNCMYRFIRANRNGVITVDDLVANCNVSENTAREYLKMLTRRAITRRIDMPNNQKAKYRMINDPGPNLVRNDANTEKLRRIRAAQKEVQAQMDLVSAALDSASTALLQARTTMAVIEKQADDS